MAVVRNCSNQCAERVDSSWPVRLAPVVFALAILTLGGLLVSEAETATSFAKAAGPAGVEAPSPIPPGIILPARLESTLSVKDAHRGDAIEAHVAQDVPLPDRGEIRARSVVHGTVLAVEKDTGGPGVKLTLGFRQIEDRKESLSAITSLRALASYRSVQSAQMSLTGPDSGTPAGWANTVQIGGDIRFGDGGLVRNRAKQKVGKGVLGGVLVHVKANPVLGCDGPVNGDDHPQALWVFSADACGVYGLKGVQISQKGNKPPFGEITLRFEKEDMKLEPGTGMLLRVVAQP